MYEKLTKKEKVQEAKRRIEEAVSLNEYIIDLSGLDLDEKDDIFIPEVKLIPDDIKEYFGVRNIWFNIDLSNNNFKSIKNLPSSIGINLNNNKNLKYIDLTNPVYYLLFDNTGIETFNDIKNINNIKNSINFSDTPLEKKYTPLRKVNKAQVKTRINEDNIKYDTYIIPKGTILFRNFERMEDLSSVYIGFQPKENDGNYYLHPDQYTFFFTSPKRLLFNSLFGNISSIFVLQNDIEVLLGFRPAIRGKSNINKLIMFKEDRNYKTIFVEDCKPHKVKSNQKYEYKCFKKEYKDSNIY
jgi:hypothetical protein